MRYIFKIQFLAFVAVLFLCSSFSEASSKYYSGYVVNVGDGDTIDIQTESKNKTKIRLYGIDCPELEQDFGTNAKEFTSNKVLNKNIYIEEIEKDTHGRTVAVVWYDNKKNGNLNQDLVRNGLAWWYKKHAPDSKTLEKLQSDAQKQKIGLWSLPNPIPPWELKKETTNDSKSKDPTIVSNNTPSNLYIAYVVDVVDGDTIKIQLEPNNIIRIGLHAVDCPELKQDFGIKAKEFTSSKVLKQNVYIEEIEKDRYGNIIANVWYDNAKNNSLNQDLVRNGFAWWYKVNSSDSKTLENLQYDAQKQRIGLWSQPNPIPPWDFRAGS